MAENMSDFQVQVGAVVKDNIQQQLNGFSKKTVTVTPILDTKSRETGTKTVTDWVNKSGELVQVTDKLNKATGEINSTITKQKKAYKDTSSAVDENSKTLKSNANEYGWNVIHYNFSEEELDDKEQYYIKEYADNGFQLRNKTSGSQGKGKTKINEFKPSKGYQDGLKQGYKDRKSTRLNSSHRSLSRMPSSA